MLIHLDFVIFSLDRYCGMKAHYLLLLVVKHVGLNPLYLVGWLLKGCGYILLHSDAHSLPLPGLVLPVICAPFCRLQPVVLP